MINRPKAAKIDKQHAKSGNISRIDDQHQYNLAVTENLSVLTYYHRGGII
jgi:hypothetical protein